MGTKRLSKRKFKVFLFFIPYFLFSILCIYGSEKSSCDFLKIGVGARNIAMGETGVTSSDTNSVYWNPAGLALIQKPEITFMYQKHFQDIYYNFLAGAYPGKIGTLSAGIYYLTIDKFQGYDGDGNETEKLYSYDFLSTILYSKTFFKDKLSLGIGLKHIQEQLAKKHTSTFAFDSGVIYYMPTEYGELRTGLSIHNIFGKIKFFEETFSIPGILRFGIRYNLNFNEIYKFEFTIETSLFGKENFNFGSGIECLVKDIFALRIGYITKYTGFRAGIGFVFSNFIFDYSYSPYGELGISHRFSTTIKFGKIPYEKKQEIDKLYQNGLDLYNEKRYLEAIFEFNKILEIDPLHQDAFYMLKKCNENINK